MHSKSDVIKAVHVVRIFKIFFVILDICPALTTAQVKNIDIAPAITW